MTILVLILTLLTTAFTLLIDSGNLAVLLSSGISALSGGILVYIQLAGHYRARLTWLLAGGLLSGYGGGALNTLLTYALSGADGAAALGVPKGYVAYAFFLVFLSSAFLLAAGFLEPPFFRTTDRLQVDGRLERALWISLLLVGIGYWHGDLGYQGITVGSGTSRIPFYGYLVLLLPNVCFTIASVGILQTSGRTRVRMVILAVLHFIAVLPQSRRPVFYTLLTAAFAIAYLLGRKIRVKIQHQVLAVAIAGIAVVFAFYSFMALRIEMDKLNSKVRSGSLNAPLIMGVHNTLQTALFSRQEVYTQLMDNMKDRTFVIKYLALLGKGGNTPSPMLGQDALFSIQLEIPDVVYRIFGSDKSAIRDIGAEEGLINEHFGLPVYDDSNSLLTAGIADFGVAGVIAYPILVCVAYRFLLYCAGGVFSRESCLVVQLILIFIILQTENDLAGYISIMRTVVMTLLLWSLLKAIPDYYRKSNRSVNSLGAGYGPLRDLP